MATKNTTMLQQAPLNHANADLHYPGVAVAGRSSPVNNNDTGHYSVKTAYYARRVSYKPPLNAVLQVNATPVDHGGQIMEADWIVHSVFGPSIDRPVRVHFAHQLGDEGQPLLSDSVYVFLFAPKPADLFDRLKRDGYTNFAAYHMGGELKANSTHYYSVAWAVFRNHWTTRYAHMDNVLYTPLGIKSGLVGLTDSAVLMPASPRRYLCNFVGSIRANRQYMLNRLTYGRDRCHPGRRQTVGRPERSARDPLPRGTCRLHVHPRSVR